MNDAELRSFCNEMIGKFKMLSDLQREMQYELIDTKFTEWELKKLIFALDVLRTIADRPQGEWIDAEIPLECGGSMPIQVCNLCKTFYPLAYTGGGHRFCPNCGARMKGADDDI